MQNPVRGFLHGTAAVIFAFGAVFLWIRCTGDLSRQIVLLIFGASRLLGQGLGPILGGLILAWSNGQMLFTALALLLAAAGFAQYRVMRREEQARLGV